MLAIHSSVKRRRLSAAEIALLGLGVITVTAFSLVGQGTQETLERARSASRTGSVIASRLGESHLRLEEHVSGGHEIDVDREILGPLDASMVLCQQRLTGGRTAFGPLSEPSANEARRISSLCGEIGDLRKLTRLRATDPSGEGTNADLYEEAFNRAAADAEREMELSDNKIDLLDRRFDNLRMILVTTIFLLFIVSFIILRRHLNVVYRRSRELADAYEKVDAALEQAKRFERLRREMVSNISHELRTPLVPILGWSQLLSRRPSMDPASVQEYATTINKGALRLSQIVENLLQVAAEGPRSTRVSDVRVATIAQGVADAVRSRGRTNVLRVDEGLEVVATDRRVLISALAHIVDNAVKFSPPDSSVEFHVFRRDGEAVFSVIDEGPGFPEGATTDFQLFVQGDGSTTRTHGGTGVGLFLASTMADELGGYVEAVNEQGRGARVSLVLTERSVSRE